MPNNCMNWVADSSDNGLHDRFSSSGKVVTPENHCSAMFFSVPDTPPRYSQSHDSFLIVVYPALLATGHRFSSQDSLHISSREFLRHSSTAA